MGLYLGMCNIIGEMISLHVTILTCKFSSNNFSYNERCRNYFHLKKQSYRRKLDPISRGMVIEHTFVEPDRPDFYGFLFLSFIG